MNTMQANIDVESLQVFARQAAVREPSIVDKAADLFAQNPELVKSIGVGAVALLMSRLSASRG